MVQYPKNGIFRLPQPFYVRVSLLAPSCRNVINIQTGGKVIDESRRNIIDRDKRDSSRDIAPLKIAPSALLVDSSDLSIEQVTKKILDFIRTDPCPHQADL